MNPAQYDAWYDSPLGAACLESELALLRRRTGELTGKEILEVGCGTGRFLFALGHDAARAVGVDRDSAMLDFARKHTPPDTGNRFAWIQGDAHAVPLAYESFDVVFENTLFCFCKDWSCCFSACGNRRRRRESWAHDLPLMGPACSVPGI
jgi:SAM-dependent methyltransferase